MNDDWNTNHDIFGRLLAFSDKPTNTFEHKVKQELSLLIPLILVIYKNDGNISPSFMICISFLNEFFADDFFHS